MGLRERFAEQGYLAPLKVLSSRQCRQFLQAVGATERRPPLDWDRGCAVTSRSFYEIARHPAIVDVVVELLGRNVMLWGASLQDRSPGEVHPWHSDIESADPTAKTVSVWIGLEHTSRESCVSIVPYSHSFGLTVQEIRKRHGRRREQIADEDVAAWARELDERSELVTPTIEDGEAFFFEGKLWHGSNNRVEKTRRALLLQYATPDTRIRIPDYNYLDWPFRLLDSPRAGCLMLRGSGKAGINRYFSAPAAAVDGEAGPQLTSRVYPLRIPLEADYEEGWKYHPIFYGSTPDMRSLSCHASALIPHHRAHPLHTHRDEELKLLLAGEVDLIFSDDEAANGAHRRRLKAGQFAYYPPELPHTLETVSDTPANYITFRWHSDPMEGGDRIPFGIFDVRDPVREMEGFEGFCPSLLFEGSTPYLRKLHAHFSTLAPGVGYDPHVDSYAAVIIVLEGEVETLGERVGPHGVILFAPGEPHGMRNSGTMPARYLVFEFHASQSLPEADDGHAQSHASHGLKARLARLVRRFGST